MPTDEQYQRLLALRQRLRQFDQWSRAAAEEHGLTHHQHQLLLAIRGSTTPGGPTIGEVADALLLKHHSASELIDRCQGLGLVIRTRDEQDHRRVRLALSARGHDVIAELTDVHVAEFRRLGPVLDRLSDDF